MTDARTTALLEYIISDTKAILGDSLVGIYLHGSLALGCFRWAVSDIDYLTVVEGEPTQAQKEELVRSILAMEGDCPPKGIEMSVVRVDACRNFVHPTPYVLHYSNAWRDSFCADLSGTCRDLHGADPDLAAHFTVTRAAGITLCGAPIAEVFAPVPREAYLDSLRYDFAGAEDDIAENPVYVILNLCRTLGYLQDGVIRSKAQGGEWGLAHLPEDAGLISAALAAYRGDGVFPHDIPAPVPVNFVRRCLEIIEKA